MAYTSTKKQWTNEEENEMIVAIKNNEPFETIAQRHSRTPNAIKLRFGMICKKQLETTKRNMDDLCREYHIKEQTILKCMDDLESVQMKNKVEKQQSSLSPGFDIADISIIKEEILILNEKIDKIYRYVKKLMELSNHKKKNNVSSSKKK